MSAENQKPIALVTGASRGIGKGIALSLAQDGFLVFLTYVSKPEKAQEVVEEIERAGGCAKAFKLDIGDTAAISEFFSKEIATQSAPLSVLVNNAGITKDGLILRMKDEDFEQVFRVNVGGAFACMREASKIMTKQRFGSIIHIGSVVGQMGNAGQANYAAAKAGLIGMAKSAAKELGGRNITVNVVAPGFIETDMTAELNEDQKKRYAEAIPLRRFGSVEDVAELVAFLASSKARYITGQVLAVNGGLYC